MNNLCIASGERITYECYFSHNGEGWRTTCRDCGQLTTVRYEGEEYTFLPHFNNTYRRFYKAIETDLAQAEADHLDLADPDLCRRARLRKRFNNVQVIA